MNCLNITLKFHTKYQEKHEFINIQSKTKF